MSKFQSIKNKAVMGTVLLAGSIGVASAALPPEATAAFTTMQTDATSLLGSGWGLVTIVAGGLVLIGLFKKILGRST